MANTPTIREALEALDELPASPDDDREMGLRRAIRAALEAAEAEAECWRVIWDAANHVEITPPGGHVTTWDVVAERGAERPMHSGATRLEALQKAAEFCRKELA